MSDTEHDVYVVGSVGFCKGCGGSIRDFQFDGYCPACAGVAGELDNARQKDAIKRLHRATAKLLSEAGYPEEAAWHATRGSR